MEAIERMPDLSYEKSLGALGAALGGIVAALKLWKVSAPKFWAWRTRVVARKAFAETAIAKLEEIAERQARIELTMSFSLSHGEMTLMLAGVAAWKSNTVGECTFIAPALAELLGMDRAAAHGNGWLSSVHTEDRGFVAHDYRLAVAERRVFSAWYRYKHDDGKVLYIHGLAYPAINPSTGQVQEYWGRAKQITKEEWLEKRNG